MGSEHTAEGLGIGKALTSYIPPSLSVSSLSLVASHA